MNITIQNRLLSKSSDLFIAFFDEDGEELIFEDRFRFPLEDARLEMDSKKIPFFKRIFCCDRSKYVLRNTVSVEYPETTRCVGFLFGVSIVDRDGNVLFSSELLDPRYVGKNTTLILDVGGIEIRFN